MTHQGLVEAKSISRRVHRETTEKREELAVRINDANEQHHLWNNNGTWFIHYTVCPTPLTARRVRYSLKTKSLVEAILKRDRILGRNPEDGKLKPAALKPIPAFIGAGI